MIEAPVRTTWTFPKGHLSPSQVLAYMRCGECYRAGYVLKIPRSVGIDLPIGSGVHKGVEHLRRRFLEDGSTQVAEAIEAAGEGFDAAVEVPLDAETGAELIVDLKKYGDLGEAKDKAVALARYALPIIAELDRERGLLATEYDLADLPDEVRAATLPFEMRGRIDALYGIDGTPDAMVDLKTSGKKQAPDTMASIQFSCYGLFFHKNGQPLRLGADVLAKTAVPAFDTWWLGDAGFVSDAEYDYVEGVILDVADKISAGYFPPRPSFLCNYIHGFPNFSVAVSGFGE